MRIFGVIVLFAFTFAAHTHAGPVTCSDIEVIDGDTVRYLGRTYRLTGFDAPEMGRRARCEIERQLAKRAAARLKQILAGSCDLSEVRCPCPEKTLGTWFCNYRRNCGLLTVGGRDVAETLILEGLARPFRCSKTKCPKIKT